jgi:hypothetical protein
MWWVAAIRQSGGVNRSVGATLELDVHSHARLAVQIGVAHPAVYSAAESIEIALDGVEVRYKELASPHVRRGLMLYRLARIDA